jgi:hypothetical protein
MTQLATTAFQRRPGNPLWSDDARFARENASDPNSRQALDRRLDRALEDTFPASDPISIMISVGP